MREVSNPSRGDDDPFREQKGALGKQIAPVAAQLAAGGDDSMARDRRVARRAHDIAHGTMRARTAGRRGDVAVRGNPPMWNAAHD